MTARGSFVPRILSALPEVFENPIVGAGAISRAPTAVPFVGLFALLGPRRT